MSVLHILSTPIGNLEDITLRAIRILKESVIIAAEDTRTTKRLLAKYQITNKIISYTDHNSKMRIPVLLKYLDQGDIALVSEAGTPSVSDPGSQLIQAISKTEHVISPVPGASAVTAALSIAGLPSNQWIFIGFMPRKPGQKKKIILWAQANNTSLVFFESPYRILSSLKLIQELSPTNSLVICRELTKLYEEVFRGNASEALEHFIKPKGEFTIIIQNGKTRITSS
tara:strand:+ start:1039 stop:1719 length:681 start_codon:yes stop_codon:yes gene_type:complete